MKDSFSMLLTPSTPRHSGGGQLSLSMIVVLFCLGFLVGLTSLTPTGPWALGLLVIVVCLWLADGFLHSLMPTITYNLKLSSSWSRRGRASGVGSFTQIGINRSLVKFIQRPNG